MYKLDIGSVYPKSFNKSYSYFSIKINTYSSSNLFISLLYYKKFVFIYFTYP